MDPIKIGITCYPTYGGSGVVGTELGIELAARGHEVHFITSAWPFRLREPDPRIHFHEVEAMTYPLFEHPPFTLALANKMAGVAESEGLDLLHVHYAIPFSVSAFLARSMRAPRRLPFITTLHGTDITLVGADSSYLGITRFAIEHSDAVTAISQYLEAQTCETFEISNKIEVISNFVNCDTYLRSADSDCRSRFASANEKILVHLSNFRPVKRVTDVVEIFARVRREVPSKLLLVGDGPERTAAELVAHRRGVHSDTLFLGKQDNVERILGLADVLLLPSEMESFGLAALEGMACEVPAVASRVGGLPELITHGVDGYLAELGDLEAMAGYAIAILQDAELRQRLGQAARASARKRFCSSLIIPRYEDLYCRVLERAS